MKILLRATNWLGDAVMSLPALRAVREVYPAAEISVLARPWVADLYARESFADRILPYDRQGSHRGFGGRWRLANQLRAERFDLAILFQNAFDAALLAWLSRASERIGYARDGRSALLTQPIEVPASGQIPAHERYYYLELLHRAGLIPSLPDCPDIRLDGLEDAARAGRAGWRQRGLPEGPWIGVSPGAAYGGAKRWLPERFAAAASTLADELGASVALFGAGGEAELCETIAAGIGPRAFVLAGKTSLREYIELASTCSLYLTNDSGPMHVACALGVPTVAIFGATNHVTTGPSASWARVVREPVECSPCLLRECPLPEHLCMLGVSAERVVAAAHELLAGAAGPNTHGPR
ncbi:MAG: lipopolysaccharide heptosyltransferase II [Acidobacteria bacterium]|nr:lipopolysaccharide heptosyltransferase II [Acidobacteriota bacterium]